MIFFIQLLMIFIKTADISNEVRPPSVSEPWADCLFEEYFNQVLVHHLHQLYSKMYGIEELHLWPAVVWISVDIINTLHLTNNTIDIDFCL